MLPAVLFYFRVQRPSSIPKTARIRSLKVSAHSVSGRVRRIHQTAQPENISAPCCLIFFYPLKDVIEGEIMQKDKTSRLIYSASDLVNFSLCPSITLYDLQNLETPLEKAEDDPYT